MIVIVIIWWGVGQNWWSFMDKYGGKCYKKIDVYIIFDQDVF